MLGDAAIYICSLSIYYCLSQHVLLLLSRTIFVNYSLKHSRPSDFYTIVGFSDSIRNLHQSFRSTEAHSSEKYKDLGALMCSYLRCFWFIWFRNVYSLSIIVCEKLYLDIIKMIYRLRWFPHLIWECSLTFSDHIKGVFDLVVH